MSLKEKQAAPKVTLSENLYNMRKMTEKDCK